MNDPRNVDDAWDEWVNSPPDVDHGQGLRRSKDQYLADRNDGYDGLLTKQLLRLHGLSRYEKAMRRSREQVTEDARLCTAWFYEYFPDYPVWLTGRVVRDLHRVTPVDLYQHPTKTPAWLAYQDALKSAPEPRPAYTGIAFAWRGIGHLVLSDYDLGKPFGYYQAFPAFGKDYTIEKLDSFVKRLSWSPPTE